MISRILAIILIFVTIMVIGYPDDTIHWINKYKRGISLCSCKE